MWHMAQYRALEGNCDGASLNRVQFEPLVRPTFRLFCQPLKFVSVVCTTPSAGWLGQSAMQVSSHAPVNRKKHGSCFKRTCSYTSGTVYYNHPEYITVACSRHQRLSFDTTPHASKAASERMEHLIHAAICRSTGFSVTRTARYSADGPKTDSPLAPPHITLTPPTRPRGC